jgi:hypothetical protein
MTYFRHSSCEKNVAPVTLLSVTFKTLTNKLCFCWPSEIAESERFKIKTEFRDRLLSLYEFRQMFVTVNFHFRNHFNKWETRNADKILDRNPEGKRYWFVEFNSDLQGLHGKFDRRSAGQKMSCFYGTRKFSIVFMEFRHWNLHWTTLIQFNSSHPVYLRSLLTLFSHLG